MEDCFVLLKECIEKLNLKEISKKLDVSYGTVRRWILLEKVPSQYRFDFMKILGKDIDYTLFSSASKDQIFTSKELATKCWEIFQKHSKIHVSEYVFVEPSAGDGSFIGILPENSVFLDIEPRHPRVLKQDFLSWIPEVSENPKDTCKKYVVFGNPPFGLRGNLALKFINHSSTFADYTCFILPQMFGSDGKGSPMTRISTDYKLIHSENLIGEFSAPDSTKSRNISVIFQILAKNQAKNNGSVEPVNKNIKIYSLSAGGTPGTTRNKKMLDCCDIYLPSTCFKEEDMKIYNSFEELPNLKGYGVVFLEMKEKMISKALGVDWSKKSFLSTNLSYNLRTSIILKQLL
jgi:hypothetical protein